MSSTSVDLPDAGDAGDAREATQGKWASYLAQIVFRRAQDAEPARSEVRRSRITQCARRRAVGLRRFFGTGIRARPERYCAVSDDSTCDDFLERPCATIWPPRAPGAGAEVENVIRRADRVFIVLDDDDGISEIAQPAQRGDQPVVIPLMQADARLVEHVKAAGETAADLRRQPDALRFAAAERAAFAIEGEIAEADFHEETPAGSSSPGGLRS